MCWDAQTTFGEAVPARYAHWSRWFLTFRTTGTHISKILIWYSSSAVTAFVKQMVVVVCTSEDQKQTLWYSIWGPRWVPLRWSEPEAQQQPSDVITSLGWGLFDRGGRSRWEVISISRILQLLPRNPLHGAGIPNLWYASWPIFCFFFTKKTRFAAFAFIYWLMFKTSCISVYFSYYFVFLTTILDMSLLCQVKCSKLLIEWYLFESVSMEQGGTRGDSTWPPWWYT